MKSFVLALTLLLAVSSFAKDYKNEFTSFMHKYQKSYGHDEFHTRFAIFSQNLDFIEAHNAKNLSYTVGMNQFGDLSREEFKQFYLGYKPVATRSRGALYNDLTALPTSVNWVNKGAVTPVKNQGQCGSCWSFSTTGSLEGLHFIKKGSLLSFSEQQLVDCSGSYGNDGCDGGLMDYAFEYVAAKGIELESVYPYHATDGSCKYNAAYVKFKNTGYHDVPTKNEGQLTAAIAQQPVSVAIEADSSAFQLYSGGVFDDPSCGTNLDHGVLAVGYGVSSGTPYYLVKNSWGASWGESGYIRMKRGAGSGKPGMCGIALDPSYPTL